MRMISQSRRPTRLSERPDVEHNSRYFYKGPVGVVLEPAVRLLRGRGLARRHRIFWKAHRAVWRLTRSDRVQIAGHDLQVDPRDSLALASGSYEPEEKAWYEQVLRRGDVVVEVGANIGYFSTILARAVGAEGRVICYEPDPDLNRILRRNVVENGYDNVDVREAAAAAEPGTMTFFRSAASQGDNRLFSHRDDDGQDGATFPVTVVRLDDDLADDLERLGRVDLLKMDIQGAEPLAFRGLAKTLATTPPRRMLVEFWPHGIVGMGEDPASLVQQIRAAGYDVRELGGAEFDVEAGLREMTVENLKWVNLVCTHRAVAEES